MDDRQTVYLFGTDRRNLTVYTLQYTWKTNSYALVYRTGDKTEVYPRALIMEPEGFRLQPPKFRLLDPWTEIQQ